MDDVLLGIVLQRLAESPLAEQPTDLLLAAFESEDSLSAQLGGQAAQRPSGDRAGVAPPKPVGASLRSLTVSGFRGIGKPATLTLQPGPGLTVVVGRNGNGKSSFTEALEVLLTGELRRCIQVEESELPRVLGDPYRAYQDRTSSPECG